MSGRHYPRIADSSRIKPASGGKCCVCGAEATHSVWVQVSYMRGDDEGKFKTCTDHKDAAGLVLEHGLAAQKSEQQAAAVALASKVRCPHCPRLLKPAGLQDHIAAVHASPNFDRDLSNDLWAWLRGFTKCEDCNGSGYSGEVIPGSDFQPPESVPCSSCGASGMWQVSAEGAAA